MSWIQTCTRSRFDALCLDPAQWSIEMVSRGLSNQCRFAGQLPRGVFYSVAEHSVILSLLVPPEHAKVALLHDCTEALIGDIPTPFKKLLPDYQAMELALWVQAATFFNVPIELPPCVKELDTRLCLAERDVICGGAIEPWDADRVFTPAYPDGGFQCLCPEEAEDLFINRYMELSWT